MALWLFPRSNKSDIVLMSMTIWPLHSTMLKSNQNGLYFGFKISALCLKVLHSASVTQFDVGDNSSPGSEHGDEVLRPDEHAPRLGGGGVPPSNTEPLQLGREGQQFLESGQI